MLAKSMVCLRLIVSIQCVGAAGKYLLSAREQESSLYGLLFFDWGWDESTAQSLDDVGAWFCLVAAILFGLTACFDLLANRRASGGLPPRWLTWLEFPILIFVAGWFFTLAWAEMMRGGVYTEWAIAEQAVRFMTPLALAIGLIVRDQGSAKRSSYVISGMLQISVAATFAVHGWKAIAGYGPFVDLILLSDSLPWVGSMSQTFAERLLWAIGWIDVGLALLIVGVRWRWVALYMAFWGFLTVTSRVVALGVEAWPESLIRIANGGAPLGLFFLFQQLRQVKMAESECSSEVCEESDI